jgi:hypothetical protein
LEIFLVEACFLEAFLRGFDAGFSAAGSVASPRGAVVEGFS